MANLRIGFSSPKRLFIGSEMIKLWQRRPYSHTYIRIDMNGQDCVYEASHGSVHFSRYDSFAEHNTIHKEYLIDISDEAMGRIKARCIMLKGQDYSYIGLAQIAMWDTLNTFGVKSATEDRKGYICSELVGRICVEELKIEFEKPTYLLTPADVDNKLGVLYAKVS